MDTGANMSCIGSDLANYDFSEYKKFFRLNSYVKTADTRLQKVVGYLYVDVYFKDQKRKLKILIVPTISQKLILGLDFWKEFNLAPGIFEDVIISSIESPNEVLCNINSLHNNTQNFDELPSEHLNDESSNNYPLNQIQRTQLESIKKLFPNLEKQGLGRTTLIEHDIEIGNAPTVKQRFYPVSPAVEKLMFEEIDRMLALGIIEPSTSPWSSPMRLVVKPNKIRLCLDARKLNEATKKDAYPLPNIEGIFSRLPKTNVISKLDLKDAYWQVALSERAKPLTAFVVPGRPLYQFVVMPFGLCNAPSTMCRLMDQLVPQSFVIVFFVIWMI